MRGIGLVNVAVVQHLWNVTTPFDSSNIHVDRPGKNNEEETCLGAVSKDNAPPLVSLNY